MNDDEMHMQICHFKATGKRMCEYSRDSNKRQKLMISHTGGALNGTIGDYHLNLEDAVQNVKNIFDVLRTGMYQLKDNPQQVLSNKRALNCYVSFHVNLHLSILIKLNG